MVSGKKESVLVVGSLIIAFIGDGDIKIKEQILILGCLPGFRFMYVGAWDRSG